MPPPSPITREPSAPALIFTIGHNGFAWKYRDCVRSQRAYADRFGFTHIAVDRPYWKVEPALSAWLKIPLLLTAMRGGYGHVAFLDADCEVRPLAPDLRQALASVDGVAMAAGRTGRLNSGVILANASRPSETFLESVMTSMTRPIAAADRQHLRYENGNIIACARSSEAVSMLDQRWNNAADPALADYVRHYTGPMRRTLRATPVIDAVISRATPQHVPLPEARDESFRRRLTDLLGTTLLRYPAFKVLSGAS